jgi:hypothetical protein
MEWYFCCFCLTNSSWFQLVHRSGQGFKKCQTVEVPMEVPKDRVEAKEACQWPRMRRNTVWFVRPVVVVGDQHRSTVVPHLLSRTLPSLDEVLRTFHRQACLATTLLYAYRVSRKTEHWCQKIKWNEIFELSSFTNTSYCETTHRSTPGFFGLLSLPYIHYYFTFNDSWILYITLFSPYFPIYV